MAKKKKLISKGQIAVLKATAIVLLLLLLLFMAAEALNIASVSQINDSIKSFFASLTPGEGYPYRINSSSVSQMEVLNGNLFVLTDERTISLDTTAKELKSVQHTYSNPSMKIKGNKAIVFARNDNRYRVENRTDVLHTGETPDSEKILTCAIGKKGNIAIATVADSSTSKLRVLNKSYNEDIFVWKCAQDSISAISLSDNGKYVAVSVIGSRDGEIYSKVYIFDFDYSEPVSEFEYYGTGIIDINFATNNNVVAIGDNLISFITDLKEQKNYNYGTDTLSNYTFSDDGSTILVLSEYGSTNSKKLICYGTSFGSVYEKKYQSNVKDIYAAAGRVCVMLEDKVIVYRSNGDEQNQYPVDSTAISVFNLGRTTYVYSIGKIDKCSEKK